MKKEYIHPRVSVIALHTTALLQLSGGGEGNKDDWAESRRFWGSTPWEPEEEETDSDVLFD